MTINSTAIVPCLWFNNEAEAAAKYYTCIFPRSRIANISRYPGAGEKVHGRKAGSVMGVEFEINGLRLSGLNGGPHFQFTPAISFQVLCESQEDVDFYWNKLKRGGPIAAQQCGWLKDKYGLSWQIVPQILFELLLGEDREKANRVMAAMMKMKKMNIAALRKAAG